MTSQEYLNELTKDLKVYIDIRNNKMMSVDSLFKEKGAKSENDIAEILKSSQLDDSDIDLYYSTSQLAADTNTLCKKICDFLYFNNITKAGDLNIDELSTIPGFMYFMKEYKPYATTFILTPENKIKEANLEQYNIGKSKFKQVMSNDSIMSMINAERN
ncbi:MAG: hypothetical protein LBM02_09980 [Lachnospiraceae bacterium]|jgi:hypothetical protein|nr:hypothetical protein [Lachnospiraceae bacterium]